ncbi:hypothetical protein N7492_007966 [Penicillium capsulatum]|uniref:Zn(2)-C6 fungal-type domain-containing protein n=1 Tax=Penicillium capsulatum TaxID=69766 RepID=A0A9W9HR99_9EURO|nr:hypothetical protein N7492_007966 [Penicillium capsulatum]KAJ6105373.1 hypothetical protein N7512_008890 [Penicillium capsulatum]
MGDVGRPLRPIAPRTLLPGGGPDGNQPPGGGPNDDGRVRRASTACKLCQKRRTKCSGAPAPCTECATHQRECVFDQDADRRRKGSAKRTQEDLVNVRTFVNNLLSVLRDSNDDTTQQIIQLIRAGTSLEEIQAVVEQLAPTNVTQTEDAPFDPAHDHMTNFFQQH